MIVCGTLGPLRYFIISEKHKLETIFKNKNTLIYTHALNYIKCF